MSLRRKKPPANDLFPNRRWVFQTAWFVEIFRNKTETITFILGGFLSAQIIGPAVIGGVSMGWEGMCPLPQCWPEPFVAAEIGAAVLKLTILRVQALCIRQAKGMMLLFALREILYKWMKVNPEKCRLPESCVSALFMLESHDRGQCCCWKNWPLPLVIHSSLDCPMFCSFFFSVETSALAFIPFLEKYTKSEDVIRPSCLQPCTYMGGESISTSVWLLHFSYWHWLIDPKITGGWMGGMSLRDRWRFRQITVINLDYLEYEIYGVICCQNLHSHSC